MTTALKHDDKGTCWLIEKSGGDHVVFGPYGSIFEATKHAGIRYAVIRGSGLFDGKSYSSGRFHSAVASGTFYAVDGSDLR